MKPRPMNDHDGGRRKIICRPRGPFSRMHFNRDGSAKVRWPNRSSAEFVAELADFRRARRGQRLRGAQAYFCSICEGWHIGSPLRPQRHHTMPERRPDLMVELGVRAVAIMWAQNRVTVP